MGTIAILILGGWILWMFQPKTNIQTLRDISHRKNAANRISRTNRKGRRKKK